MNQKTIILTVILFALLVAGMFIYARIKDAELEKREMAIFVNMPNEHAYA